MRGATQIAPLTADLVACAIVAACRAYGDDPVRVFLAKGGPIRRALTPAAEALSRVTGQPIIQISRCIGIAPRGAARARANGGAAYAAALAVAEAEARSRLVAVSAPPASAARPSRRAEIVAAFAPAPQAKPLREADPLPAIHKPRVLTGRAARREVFEVLKAHGPQTGPDLMERLKLGEGQVRQALAELSEEREAKHDPLTAEGWRAQFWRVGE